MKSFYYGLTAVFLGFSIAHQIFGKTDNAIWLAIMAGFWMNLAFKHGKINDL